MEGDTKEKVKALKLKEKLDKTLGRFSLHIIEI